MSLQCLTRQLSNRVKGITLVSGSSHMEQKPKRGTN
ncbi:unnamed protein product [Strongylus vulgaris]|uniref:Uncharacterized protein n=1 Tax=Strongylus vulgaris TaxID=40348 RepID=A0A3P7LQW4_STRVU|nr:unnamed protein product [Strongylus vulgaris]